MPISPEPVILVEENMPGASLDGRDPSELHVVELKRWLKCRGPNQSGRKRDFVKRLVRSTVAVHM